MWIVRIEGHVIIIQAPVLVMKDHMVMRVIRLPIMDDMNCREREHNIENQTNLL
jgi:hypothetical protein